MSSSYRKKEENWNKRALRACMYVCMYVCMYINERKLSPKFVTACGKFVYNEYEQPPLWEEGKWNRAKSMIT